MKKLLVVFLLFLTPLLSYSQNLGDSYKVIYDIIHKEHHNYGTPSFDNSDHNLSTFLKNTDSSSIILKNTPDKKRVWINVESKLIGGWISYGFLSKDSYCDIITLMPLYNEALMEIIKYNNSNMIIINNTSDWITRSPNKNMTGVTLKIVDSEFMFYYYFIKP